jgi:hypothetical protein
MSLKHLAFNGNGVIDASSKIYKMELSSEDTLARESINTKHDT